MKKILRDFEWGGLDNQYRTAYQVSQDTKTGIGTLKCKHRFAGTGQDWSVKVAEAELPALLKAWDESYDDNYQGEIDFPCYGINYWLEINAEAIHYNKFVG